MKRLLNSILRNHLPLDSVFRTYCLKTYKGVFTIYTCVGKDMWGAGADNKSDYLGLLA